MLTQWIANAVVILFFPLAFNQMGKAVTFDFLAAMAMAQMVFTWFFEPETKNATLEEIEEVLENWPKGCAVTSRGTIASCDRRARAGSPG